jgi:protocatechuate 3,4-dioxygenase beta subunit
MGTTAKRTVLLGLAAILLAALLVPPVHAGGIPITGRILAPGGAPLAEARVDLLPLADEHRAGRLELEGKATPEPVATALSDVQGNLRLTAPEVGMWKVAVRVPGHVPLESNPLALVDEAELPALELVPDRGLAVRVLDPAGRPIAGARVRAEPSAYAEVFRGALQGGWRPARRLAWTDERGEAVLPWASGEELRLRAFAPGFGESGELVVREGGATLRLAPAGSLEVELLEADGRPAAGVLVRVGEGDWPAGLSDDRGRLALPRAAGGALRLTLTTAKGMEQTGELSSEEMAQGGSPVRLSLSPPILLTGRVLRLPDGRPIPGALVWPRDDPAGAVRTGSRGGYAVINNHEGPGAILAAAPGYLQNGIGFETPADQRGAGELAALQLQPTGLVEGRVVDEEGNPVQNAQVRATLEQQTSQPPPLEGWQAEARTSADGRFRFRRLLPSEGYHLTATKSGYATASQTVQSVQGRSALPAELVLVKGRRVLGRVVEEAGRPVAGARIVFKKGEPVFTGGSGEFTIPDPSTGVHDLRVYRPGFAPLILPSVEVAEKDLRIDLGTLTLRKAIVLDGRVIDPEGKPVAGAKIVAGTLFRHMTDRLFTHEEMKGMAEPGAAVTDAEGRFRIGEILPGERFNLYVKRSGYVGATLGGIRATGDRPLEVVLRPEATVAGRVLDEAGEPVPNATVRLLPEVRRIGFEDFQGTTSTGPDGRFLLRELDAGPVRLVAAAKGRGTAELDLTLGAGQELKDLAVTLRTEGPTLEGRVFDGRGLPLAGASVSVLPVLPLPEGGSATTDENGSFRIEGLLLGEAKVFVSRPQDFRHVHRQVRIQPGRNEVELTFPPGHVVSGRVVDGEGAPVADIFVRIESVDTVTETCQGTSAADGSFTLCELPDGSYRIHAWNQERGGTAWLPLKVAGKPVTDVELRIRSLGRIIGQIRGFAPDQLLALQVGASNGSDHRTGRINHAGRYEISALLPGRWEVFAWHGNTARTAFGSVTLEPGAGEAVLDLEARGDLTLSGRVLREGGGMADVSVVLHKQPRTSFLGIPAVLDSFGSFSVEGLEAGTYQLEVKVRTPSEVLYAEIVELPRDDEIVIAID